MTNKMHLWTMTVTGDGKSNVQMSNAIKGDTEKERVSNTGSMMRALASVMMNGLIGELEAGMVDPAEITRNPSGDFDMQVSAFLGDGGQGEGSVEIQAGSQAPTGNNVQWRLRVVHAMQTTGHEMVVSSLQ